MPVNSDTILFFAAGLLLGLMGGWSLFALIAAAALSSRISQDEEGQHGTDLD